MAVSKIVELTVVFMDVTHFTKLMTISVFIYCLKKMKQIFLGEQAWNKRIS